MPDHRFEPYRISAAVDPGQRGAIIDEIYRLSFLVGAMRSWDLVGAKRDRDSGIRAEEWSSELTG